MQFDVVFDVAQQNAVSIWWVLAGLPLLLVALGLTILRKRIRSNVPASIAWLVAVPGIFWMTATGVNILGGRAVLKEALSSNRCEVVEGRITALDPMPFAEHKDEMITVGDKRFYYSDYGYDSGLSPYGFPWWATAIGAVRAHSLSW
jgi:hypothetical protein